jgi:hypothetical protein
MPTTFQTRFIASCLGGALGESIGMACEGMTPEQIRERFGRIKGPAPRPESHEFYPLPAGSTARQTEALLAVLKSSSPLPDLPRFAFHIKDAFNRFPTLWPKDAAFPWPPFPDEGHYTFAFALPAAYALAQGDRSNEELADWLKSFAPVSIVWQQGTWVYLRLLTWLFGQDPTRFDPDLFVTQTLHFMDEAESHFPHDHKLKRRMRTIQPLLGGNLDQVAQLCGHVDVAAENILCVVGAVFHKFAHDPESALLEGANLGGCTGAVTFYTGTLLGALHGRHALPESWIETMRVHESVDHAARQYVRTVDSRQ